MLSGLTRDGAALRRTLETQPTLAYGTRIYDAITRSLGLLRDAKLSSGSIVLLSDGADIGSLRSLDQAVAAAEKQQVRVFTVGLRSGAYDPAPLRAIAERTGGTYAEARSAAELDAVYEELGAQLAGEYLVRYRSAARRWRRSTSRSRRRSGQGLDGVRCADAVVAAAVPSLALSRFLLSAGSPVVLSLLIALLVCALLFALARRPQTTVVDRVKTFAGSRSTRDWGRGSPARADA